MQISSGNKLSTFPKVVLVNWKKYRDVWLIWGHDTKTGCEVQTTKKSVYLKTIEIFSERLSLRLGSFQKKGDISIQILSESA